MHHHRIWLYISIIIVFCIGAILIYGSTQTSLLQKQGQIKGAQIQAGNPSCGLSPSSGFAGDEFTISCAEFHANNSEVSIVWDSETLFTSSNTTDALGNFIANASVPENAAAGNYKIEIQTTGLELAIFNNKSEFNWQDLFIKTVFAKKKTEQTTKKAHAFFTVTEPEPTPTITSSTTTTPIQITSTPTESTTATASQSTAPAPVTNTNTQDISSQPIPETSTTSSNPRVSALPIIVQDEQNSSDITIDKDKAPANGEDEITITIDLENDEIPQIEVSGTGNILSEIKKEDQKYFVSLKSTVPEEKIIKITTANKKKLSEVKISFVNNNDIESENNSTNPTPFYEHWEYWIIAGLILLTLGICLMLYNKNKQG